MLIFITAASIIAKEYHDEHIREICQEDETLNVKYDLLKNMGYGTRNIEKELKIMVFQNIIENHLNLVVIMFK